ncbi:MAG: DUF805 domain-containing protein [Polaribacter sp.]|uniref:DUF805 domain-containing protein n=1 Tax=Polaribacter sp. TaxID=1920175 RepID=UPI003266DC98
MNWYLKVLKEHYFDFTGRARRQEFWMFMLINFIIAFVLGLLDNVLGLNYGATEENGILSTIYSLLVFIPTLALYARRLHDYGKSGWWILLIFFIIVGWIWLLIWFCMEGENRPNKWGENPKGIGNDSTINEIGRE